MSIQKCYQLGFVYGVTFVDDDNPQMFKHKAIVPVNGDIKYINYSYARTMNSVRAGINNRFPDLKIKKIYVLDVFHAQVYEENEEESNWSKRLVGLKHRDLCVLERDPEYNMLEKSEEEQEMIKERMDRMRMMIGKRN